MSEPEKFDEPTLAAAAEAAEMVPNLDPKVFDAAAKIGTVKMADPEFQKRLSEIAKQFGALNQVRGFKFDRPKPDIPKVEPIDWSEHYRGIEAARELEHQAKTAEVERQRQTLDTMRSIDAELKRANEAAENSDGRDRLMVKLSAAALVLAVIGIAAAVLIAVYL